MVLGQMVLRQTVSDLISLRLPINWIERRNRMKCLNTATCVLLVGFMSLMPLSATASDRGEGRAPLPKFVQKTDTPANASLETKEKKLATAARMPVYKPPQRGAPGGRIAGGTRGGANLLLLRPQPQGESKNKTYRRTYGRDCPEKR